MSQPSKIYILYASEDDDVKLRLLHHLRPLEEECDATIWHNDPILKGQPWKPQDESHLHEADIFVLLLSNAFMYSEFVQQLEFKTVIDRYKAGEVIVIPMLLEDCPWDTNFESDDYNFSFKELQVFPDHQKYVRDGDNPEQIYEQVVGYVRSMMVPVADDLEAEEADPLPEEEQIAINFSEESQREEAKKRKELAEAEKEAEEQRRLQEELVTKERIEAERLQKEAEAKARIKERQRQEAEARQREEEAKQKEDSEINRRLEDAKRKAQEENQQKKNDATTKTDEVTENSQSANGKRRVVLGVLLGIFVVYALWFFTRDSEEPPSAVQENQATKIQDSVVPEKVKVVPEEKEEPLAKLAIGDQHEGGIVFEMDPNGQSGKIVHIDDRGPMPWNDAMKIHERLGEGWRLPTFDELKALYATVGQGADNRAEFADKLYWSATLYDDYQARLLQFRTGNTSYHYNKEVEHRKFLVRAVRDFTR